MFKLLQSETKSLTPKLPEVFRTLTPSPTERAFDPVKKVEAEQLISFNWAGVLRREQLSGLRPLLPSR
jgi:hypothetical protein